VGFRYRKSVRIAPGIRLNVSRRGVGVSAGVKGLRYSLSPTGRRRRTVSLPGTGISYVTSSSGRRASKHDVAAGESAPRGGALAWVKGHKVVSGAAAVMVAAVVGSIGGGGSTPTPSPASAAQTVTTPSPESAVALVATPKPSVKPSPTAVRTSSAPKPQPRVQATTAPVATDPDYGTCAAAKAAGAGPYYQGRDPEYDWYRDRDHDGVVCE
jgi:hypothetical protein